MQFGMNTLDDLHLNNKTALCRVDINQAINWETGGLKDTTRIAACLPTLREISAAGAKLVLLAHQGSDIEYQNFYTTRPHAAVLADMLNRQVGFIPDVCGPAALATIKNLKNGEILLLDNVRYLAEEQTLFEQALRLTHPQQAKTLLVRKLAPLADVYVCDAFAAAHRDQPSLCGFPQLLPSAMGRLFEKEFGVLFHLMESPKRPAVFVLGGAKIDDAFMMMNRVLHEGTADEVLTGGLVAQVLLWAAGSDIGEPSRLLIHKRGYEPLVETGKQLLARYPAQIKIPVDFAYVKNGKRIESAVGTLPAGEMVVDIGSNTAAKYQKKIRRAKTVFANGPMGIFEQNPSELGTKMVWDALGDTQGYSVIGGGDSIAAAAQYDKTGKIDYICTGGGALIRFLAGEELPVVKALRYGAATKQGG